MAVPRRATGRSACYVRRWREADITRLFEGYAIGRPQPFRDGSILVLRKPRV